MYLPVNTTRSSRWIALIVLAMFAQVVYSFARGNRASYILGDLYQIFEIAAVFLLTLALVRSEQSWRALVNVLLASIVLTSLLQLVDAAMGANYLAPLVSAGTELPRTINMR